jgi:hypothetical protein
MRNVTRVPKSDSAFGTVGCGRRQWLAGGAALFAAATISRSAFACRKSRVADFPADVALDWYALCLHLTQTTPGFSPPVASRAFGYLGVALYEALQPGMPGYRSLANLMPGLRRGPRAPENLHYGLVANTVLAEMMRRLYAQTSAENAAAIESLRQSYETLYRAEAGGHFHKSTHRGVAVAEHIFGWSKSDGGHEAYLNNFPAYEPPAGPGLWAPTLPGFQPALQPYWGRNRAFALPTNSAFDPGPHQPSFSTDVGSPFYNVALQPYDAVNNPVGEQAIIAAFWSDDPGKTSTPPGHSLSIAAQVIAEEDLQLDVATEIFMKLGIAVADAFISCWDTKYRYNVVRPVTYVREHIDSSWLPLLGTPPFPEYTSGHSVQSGAMAEVLADVFGDDFPFVDHTHDSRGFAPRHFSSFTQAANEAAISRLYGGIHYLPAIELGVIQGRKVGAQVNSLPIRY